MKARTLIVAIATWAATTCTYDPPPDVRLAAGENPNFVSGEPIILRFSEPIDPATLKIRVWSGKSSMFDIEGVRNPFDKPILDTCTLDTSPCHREFDCDDQDSTVAPRAVETCVSDKDLDCDGVAGGDGCLPCSDYYRDDDGDAYGVEGDSRCLYAPEGAYTAVEVGDCDDGDHSVNPGAREVCGNSRDEDCDGEVDETADVSGCGGDADCIDMANAKGCSDCIDWYLDEDGDTYGVADDSICLVAPKGGYRAAREGDCNDADPALNPGAEEKCNLIDDNCNGRVDEPGAMGCVFFYHDNDGDGSGAAGNRKCLCAADLDFQSMNGDDCDDSDYFVHPGADEICDNDRDDDCDSTTDEASCKDCVTLYRDADGDGFGIEADSICATGKHDQYTAYDPGDCDDFDAAINPGVEGVCDADGGKCGAPDKGSCGEGDWYYRDKDGDGYGDTGERRCLCAAEGLYAVTRGGDCNDGKPWIGPQAEEVCTTGSGGAVDEDCDGVTDEEGAKGCTTWYFDNDGDTAGSGESRCLCGPDGLFDTGEVALTLNEGRTEAWIDVDDGALGPFRSPLVLEVMGTLADEGGNALNIDRAFDFQIVGGGFDIETCGKAALPQPLDVVEGPFLFFTDFPSPPSPIPLSQQFFSDIQVDESKGGFVVLLTDADPIEGKPLNTKDPKELNMDTGIEGFIFSVRGCMASDKTKGLQFETFPFTLALTIGPIHFELRNNVLRGRIGVDPETGLAKWDGTMFVQELYMLVGGEETFYPPAQANFQMLQLREEDVPDGMATVCGPDPCGKVGGSCDLLDPWPPVEECK